MLDLPAWYLRWIYDGGEARHCGAADYDLPDGRFYTQAGGGRGRGFAVADADGAPFYTGFLERGGPAVLGYPLSRRYADGKFVSQAFDNYVLRWDPTGRSMSLANTLDDLSGAGFDTALLADHGIAKATAWTQDTGRSWDTILQNHLALLDRVDKLKDAFLARDYLSLDGLPMAVTATVTKQVIRAQRTALVWDKDTGVSVVHGATSRQAGRLLAR